MGKTTKYTITLTEKELDVLHDSVAFYKEVLRSRADRLKARYGHRDDSPSRARYNTSRSLIKKINSIEPNDERKSTQLKIDPDFNPDIKVAVRTLVPIFHAFGWTWGDNSHTPTANEIEKEIKRQIKDLVLHPEYEATSCGRITCTNESDGSSRWIGIYLDVSHIWENE